MQSNITQLKITGFCRTALMVFTLFCLSLGKINAQTYSNGPLSTGATSSNGTAAPAGYTWSEVQNPNTNAGFGANITAGLTIADNFIVVGTWSITGVTFYAYSTGWAGAASPFVDVRVQIYNTDPSVGSPAPIWGDLTTNRFVSSTDAMMYRIFNATPGTTRKIWAVNANVNTTLAAGTYWIEWQLGNGGISNFSPAVTIVGAATQPGWNAKQRTLPAAWVNLTDGGGPQDMPFLINYTTTACTGTPAPGNTIASPTAVCPGQPIVLSLQNATAGSGVTYQWQSSPTGTAGSFTNIAGATNSTYNTTLTATTYFQAIVTCSGNSGTSTPVQATLNTPAQCYCTSAATNVADEDIFRVTVGTLNNSSTCTSVGPGFGSLQNRYSNYTSGTGAPAAPNIIVGANMPFSVQIGTCGGNFTNSVAIWIDFNQDGTFQATERAYVSPSGTLGAHTETGTLTISPTALLGITRMRVVNVETGAPNSITPCGTYAWGETEDYNVNIVPCVQGVITTQPQSATIGCSGNASFTVGTTGSLLTYLWEYRTSPTGPWLLVPNPSTIYSGQTSSTLTLLGVPSTFNGYQYRVMISGPCTAADFSQPATLTVGPLVAVVTPASANICAGTLVQLSLPASSSQFCSGPVNIQIPDAIGPPASSPAVCDAGINHTIPVTIPTGATISAISVTLNITHPYNGDLVAVLRAPNGQILNLDYHKTSTGTAGANFINTVISSAGTATIASGTSPYTGTFRADAAIGAGAFGDPSGTGPTGFAPTTTLWSALYGTPNGNWTLAIQDPSTWGGDIGTLNNWCINITYGVPSTGVFAGPAGTIFTNAAGTTPYTGTPISTVYVQPTVTTTYTVVQSNALCTSAPTNIPITVSNTLSGVAVVDSTISTCFNGNATFTVAAAAGNMQTIQWQVSTNGGATYTNIANGGIYSGATTPTLTITGAPASASGNRYRAVVTNACNSVASNAAVFTVNPLPVIVVSANPFSALMPGMTTTLSAAVSPTNTFTYQWYRNGVLIPGATNATLVVDVDGLGDYTVVVTDANGCTSTSASKAITNSTSEIVFIYPSPNTGQFQVRYQSLAGNTSVPRMLNVYDAKGSRVFSKTFSLNVPYQRMDVDLRSHGKGVYQVELSDRNGVRIKTGRVVVL